MKKFTDFINEYNDENLKKESKSTVQTNKESRADIKIKKIIENHINELVRYKNNIKESFIENLDNIDLTVIKSSYDIHDLINDYSELYDLTKKLIDRVTNIEEADFNRFNKIYDKKVQLIDFNHNKSYNYKWDSGRWDSVKWNDARSNDFISTEWMFNYTSMHSLLE